MSKLLYIKSSPRGERSKSLAVANAFVEAYKQSHPGGEVVVKDLFTTELPILDGLTIQGKYNIIHGKEFTPEEEAAWGKVVEVIEEFKSFDKFVFAVPMWNWNIPYPLKQYIDVLTQPALTFGFDENGLVGLVDGKALIVYARGSEYPEGSDMAKINFQSPYLEFILGGVMGMEIVQSLAVEGDVQSPDKIPERRDAAIAKAREIAKTF